MKQEWEIFTLGKYLTEAQSPSGLPRGTTFSKTFAETDQLPQLTVGLGLIKMIGSSSSIDLVPPIKNSPKVLLNSFINEIAEQYLRLSEILPDQWQEALLLELGYVKKLNTQSRYDSMSDYTLFAPIPEEDKLPLLRKYGFHKVATIVAYGYTEKIDRILTIIEDLNKELPEGANYGTIMSVLSMGVPVEDLHMAVQLPLEMVQEIYNND